MEKVRPVSITHKDHYVNVAKRRASEANVLASNGRISSDIKTKNTTSNINCGRGYFADQFENMANFRAHYEGTGPEIWEQTEGRLHAFIAAAGTGGTLAGVSRYLKVFQFFFFSPLPHIMISFVKFCYIYLIS